MPNNAGDNKIGLSTGYAGRIKVAIAEYDFAKEGGAVGVISLRSDTIPSGAIILDSLLKVETALDSATDAATISIGIEGAADIRAAATAATAPALDALGAKRSALLDADAAPITTTAARTVKATVAVEDLTAGKFKVLLMYVDLA